MTFALGATACDRGSQWDAAVIDEGSRRWLSVYRDADYRVFIDTAHIHPRFDGAYTVWYRTDHRVPHLRHGRHWNREVSQALVSCRRQVYKIISADLSLGDGRPISRQRASGSEVAQQQWRDVTRGSADEATLLTTCSLTTRPEPVRAADGRVR
jgi:hypothetical protein